jgi:uncharacterized protein
MGMLDAQKKVEQSAGDAKLAINEARLAGIEPTLAVSAYEYAETIQDPYEKINQYAYAKMVAKTLVVLNTHTVPSDKIPVKPILPPYAPRTTLPETTPTPADAEKVPAVGAAEVLMVMLVLRRLYRN